MRACPSLVTLLAVAGLLAAAPAAATESDAEKAQTDTETQAGDAPTRLLTVASWGGAYSQSQRIAFVTPFEDEAGTKVKLVVHNGAFDTLRRGNGSKPPEWDVVDASAGTVERACRDGLLEEISHAELADGDNGLPAAEDFLDGALHECGVASVAWSATIAFDRGAFKKKAPSSARDFFDPETFPGKRALPMDPKYVLPLALMADGLMPAYIYRHLETAPGVERALKVLDRLQGQIVWWRRGHEPMKMLGDGRAAMALAFNGRIFHAIVREKRSLGIVWDGQIYDLDMWAIPKGTPNKEAALKFIAFSTRSDRLAEQTRWFPYGPMRKSAIARIGKHAEADVQMSGFIPTTEANFKRALRFEAAWWAENKDRLTGKFDAWRKASKRAADKAAKDEDD